MIEKKVAKLTSEEKEKLLIQAVKLLDNIHEKASDFDRMHGDLLYSTLSDIKDETRWFSFDFNKLVNNSSKDI